MPVKIDVPWPDLEPEMFEDLDESVKFVIELHDYTALELYASATTDYSTDCNMFNTGGPTTTATKSDMKMQIRNHDCMWSGRCVAHPDKAKSALAAKHRSLPTQGGATVATHHNTVKLSSQQIPAGRSLLLNSRSNNVHTTAGKKMQNTNTTTPIKCHVPHIPTSDFLKDREMSEVSVRPDTPMSIDDDTQIFKHTVDLAACTMGSNSMSLLTPEELASLRYINLLKEHFEDASSDGTKIKQEIRPFQTPKTESLSDLLQDLQEMEYFGGINSNTDVTTASLMPPATTANLHCDDDDDESGNESESGCSSRSDSSSSSSTSSIRRGYCNSMVNTSTSIEDSKNGILENYNSLHGSQSSISSLSTSSSSAFAHHHQQQVFSVIPPAMAVGSGNNVTIKQEYQATDVGDHCYTRCKTRVDVGSLGVQTPSDSEEEIDVVSVGDKTLPTNPSARDRRALQTTVADKITARIVKTSRGLKTLPPRRRCSDEDSNISSSCSSTPTKKSSGASSSMGGYATSHQYIDVTSTSSGSSRKRAHGSSKDNGPSSSKRHRGNKKQRSSPGKRQISTDTDEADTIEKRNLHNDMERQRRIGLKNLFEELKRQIPTIRDKERAPKVSILREAASLCTKLNREQEQINMLKKQQARLLHRVRSLRSSLASQWG